MPYLLGHQIETESGRKKWQYVSTCPEEIEYFIPVYGRDQRDRFACSIQQYYYVPLPYNPDKIVPYYKTFGFFDISQASTNRQAKLCSQYNCVATVDSIEDPEHVCSACTEKVCYTCRRDFKKCFGCDDLICKRCWRSNINCLLCK